LVTQIVVLPSIGGTGHEKVVDHWNTKKGKIIGVERNRIHTQKTEIDPW